jgi:hypothetical protein
MKARGLSVVIVVATLSCAAVAVAQEPDPGGESDAAPAGEDPPPESGAPPGDAPPVEAAPGPPASAAAPPDANTTFGSVGQIAISDDLEMAATRVSTEGQSQSTTEIALKPALDFFPIPNLSVGGQLIIGYASIDDVGGSISSSELGLLVRVGYNVSISETLSIWPRLSVGYDHKSADQYGLSLDSVPVDVFVPIVVQLAPHFFIGGGPMYATTLLSQRESSDEPRKSTLGLRATVGGYFRGL